MSYAINQLRYYSKSDDTTGLRNKLLNDCLDGNRVVKLGIQGPPGLSFWINSEPAYNPDMQGIIGLTGIYEIDLSDQAYITSLRFSENGLSLIDNNNNLSLIIDYIYEETEGVNI